MKKLSSLALVLAVSVSLTACGANSENTGNNTGSTTNETTNTGTNNAAGETAGTEELVPEEGASLLVWESKEERPFVEQMAKEFKEKYGVDVRIEEIGAGDQVTKLTTDGPAGIGADVVLFPHDNLGRAVSAGLVLENDSFAEEAKSENAENAVQAVTYDGKLYGYPRSVETYAMFYNKDLIATPPTTMDEVKEFAKTFNDTKANKYAFMWDIGNFYFSYPFLATTGGYVFGGNGQDAADIGLNNAGAVEGAEYFKSLKDSVLPLKSGDVNYDIKKGLFTGGTLAMNIDGPWAIGDLKKSGINFGAAPIPSINGKASVSFSGVKAWYVNAFTQYPNAAKLFARYASTKEAQLADFSLTGAIPANNDASADPAVSGDELIKAFVEQFKNSQPMPSIPEMGNVWTPIGAAMSDMWNEGKDAKTSLDNAVKQIQDANAAAGQ
ncbi:arabinogalactan oligomer/maltooligosaccharide transport system substrate-binding protein [Paenibacillus phyllosphaerae]|uniref:Maltodextrin-binding protein n=1 Tax=Paenibacillus phyllosphaerae TaxID=274593 RepID=A0A7W5AYU4_9BACL|nr:maltose ABC transporter substrate-binding protein [Paenibacillus phyllosphaerae]MBB3110631.1 arabinogalactan oligomer/maltooligosaccharide transport system substrate-binding protein [Paenibacillus phyllosphaerae]